MADEQQPIPAPSKWEQDVLQKVLMSSIKEQRSARRWGIFFKSSFFLYIIFATAFTINSRSGKTSFTEPHTALVDLVGEIGPGQSANADSVVAGLREAFAAEHSKGVILRINSPGGTPVQSSYIYDEIIRLKAMYPAKKIYSVISDIGGSGGYFIAVAGDEIYANPSSIVGSIGVLMMGFGFVDTLDKVGVEARSLSAGKNKLFLDPFSPVDADQKIFAQTLLNSIHQHFIDAVKQGRGKRLKEDANTFSGLFWTGDQALALGLIDGFGSAGFVAREIVGAENIVDYTVQEGFFDKIAQKFGAVVAKEFRVSLMSSMQPQLK